MGVGILDPTVLSTGDIEVTDSGEVHHALSPWQYRVTFRVFIRNHGRQKEVTTHFSSVERKGLSTQDSAAREDILQE